MGECGIFCNYVNLKELNLSSENDEYENLQFKRVQRRGGFFNMRAPLNIVKMEYFSIVVLNEVHRHSKIVPWKAS